MKITEEPMNTQPTRSNNTLKARLGLERGAKDDDETDNHPTPHILVLEMGQADVGADAAKQRSAEHDAEGILR